MSTPMTQEREAEIRAALPEWKELFGTLDKEELDAIEDLLNEIDRLRANEQLAAAATLKMVARHFASDYNGSGYDWECSCGAKGKWGDASWESHIRALLPDAQKLLAAHDKNIRQQERRIHGDHYCHIQSLLLDAECKTGDKDELLEAIAAGIADCDPNITEEDNGK